VTVITEDLDIPGGTGLTCQVEVVLVSSARVPVTGYTSGGQTIAGRNVVVPSTSGSWQLDLAPNTSITPSGTLYRRIVHTPRGVVADATFDVPATGGPYLLRDRLNPPP
jgi:hypothetical protein